MCKGFMNSGPTQHIAILVSEVIECLRASSGGFFLDCTFGGGGHSAAILRSHENNRVLAVDRDGSAVARAGNHADFQGDRLQVVKGTFSSLPTLVRGQRFNGVVADLGISTDQLRGARGFSFSDCQALDMRMDASQERTADEIVNTFSEQELFVLLKEGGVGREARLVARAIVQARPIRDTQQLSQVVSRAAAGHTSKRAIHPATVTFQAIRMAVNDELGELRALLDAVPALTLPSARVAIITFHSIEDRLVTRTMRDWQRGQDAPAWWPGAGTQRAGQKRPLGKLIQQKPILPGPDEIAANASARSARLRAFEFFDMH